MIKNVIFDFGNVIARFDGEHIVRQIYGDSVDYLQIAPVLFEKWPLLDSGEADYGEYAEAAARRMPEPLREPTRKFFADWYKHLPYNEGIEDVIKELKKDGYRLYVLSNAPSFFSEKRDHFEVTRHFDGMIFSADVKLVKPDKKIYELLLSKFALKPEECVFADDLEPNIEAARSLGINGYLFKNDARDFFEYIKKGCKN